MGAGIATAMAYSGISLSIAMCTGFIAAAIIWALSSRIPFGIASACFIAIIIVSIMVPDTNDLQSNLREQLAIVAVYCLIIGIVLLMREQFDRKKHPSPVIDPPATPEQTSTDQSPQTSGGLADIAVPAMSAASPPHTTARPSMHDMRRVPKGASGARVNQQGLATHSKVYKPQLAPHPLLHKGQPVRTPEGGHIMDGVIKPKKHRKLVQL